MAPVRYASMQISRSELERNLRKSYDMFSHACLLAEGELEMLRILSTSSRNNIQIAIALAKVTCLQQHCNAIREDCKQCGVKL